MEQINETKEEIEKMLKLYKQLTKEQKKEIFTEEQQQCLNSLLFFEKMENDKNFYNLVETEIGNAVWENLQ